MLTQGQYDNTRIELNLCQFELVIDKLATHNATCLMTQ